MAEIRMTRRRAAPAPQSFDPLIGYRRGDTVSVTLRITAEVVDGNLKGGDLVNWVKDAVARHHVFRAGHVGYSMIADINGPRCERLDSDPA